MKKFLIAAVLALFSLVTAHAGAINTKCPVSGKDAKKTVDVPFSFCCEKCKAKFDKTPADYLKIAATAEDGKCPLSGKAVDKDVTSKVEIGVCCEKCEAKLEENPKAYLGKVEATK
jgi:YHS domain-containing protein